jgi:hypothetical protein
VGVERITGFYYVSATETNDVGDEITINETTVSLFRVNDNRIGALLLPTATARVALDGIVAGGVTIGGNFGYASSSADVTDSGGNSDTLTISAFAFNPRVGYLYSTSERVSLWPRLGFEYVAGSVDERGSFSSKMFAITIEPMLVIHPLANTGILLGPIADIGFAGGTESDGGSKTDDTMWSVGFAAGLSLFL